MLMVTTDSIEGKRIVEVFGLVRGNTVRARAIGRDIVAGLRSILGGEISEYSQLLTAARDEAIERMSQAAEQTGANAVVGVRFVTSGIMGGASEILVYGTAVKIE
jgi:uncharacterized protein YbjQ (UPF0145 family)